MSKHVNKILDSRSDRVFNIVSTTVLTLVLVACFYPLYFVLAASFSDLNAVNSGQTVLFPRGFHLESYRRVFQNARILTGYRNTIFYTLVGTLINLAMTLTAGYGLSNTFPGRRIVNLMIVFTMYFSGGIIPTYFLYKNLGLLDTVWVMLLPGAVSAYNLIISRTFLSNNIPPELYHGLRMNGDDWE